MVKCPGWCALLVHTRQQMWTMMVYYDRIKSYMCGRASISSRSRGEKDLGAHSAALVV